MASRSGRELPGLRELLAAVSIIPTTTGISWVLAETPRRLSHCPDVSGPVLGALSLVWICVGAVVLCSAVVRPVSRLRWVVGGLAGYGAFQTAVFLGILRRPCLSQDGAFLVPISPHVPLAAVAMAVGCIVAVLGVRARVR